MAPLKNYDLCIDARLLNKSGIGRYLSELLPYLNSQYSVFCIIDKELVNFATANNIEYVISESKIYSIKEQVELVKLIPNCTLFWSPHFNVPIFPIKAKRRVVTIHDSYHLVYRKQLSLVERIYAKIFYNAALMLSDKIITVSEFSKYELIRMTNNRYGKKINVIYNGVTNFDSEKCVLPDVNPYFLFVGNVKPHKNLKNAIRAFKIFCEANPLLNFDFKIVGQKGGFINSDKQIDALILEDSLLKDRIVFTGFVSDQKLKMIYRNAYCLVFPSLYEGFGLPPLEAMTAHTPAIVSRRASMPELCGDAVLYFDPESINEIAESMSSIAKDKQLYQQLVNAGLKQVERYQWSICANQHLELFNKLVKI